MKGVEDLVRREGTLKPTCANREGASVDPSINLCKKSKLASTLLSAKDTRPSLCITGW